MLHCAQRRRPRGAAPEIRELYAVYGRFVQSLDGTRYARYRKMFPHEVHFPDPEVAKEAYVIPKKYADDTAIQI